MKEEKITLVDIDTLIPYENNPRNNEDAVQFVANSIKKFGFRNPILVDSDNVIIAGHTRLLAAKDLGIKEVPVVVIDDLSPEQVKAFRIADNSTAEVAQWDQIKLDIELKDIEFDMADFGLNYSADTEDDDEEEEEGPPARNDRDDRLPDQKVIKYKKTLIPYNDDEEYMLDNAIAKYVADNGTVIGFVDFLLKKK